MQGDQRTAAGPGRGPGLEGALARLAAGAGPTRPIEPMLAATLATAREVLGAGHATIWLVADGAVMVAAADPGAPGAGAEDPEAADQARAVATTGRAVGDGGRRLAVPLRCDGQVTGVLQVTGGLGVRYGAPQRTVLERVAEVVAGPVEAARRQRHLAALGRAQRELVARIAHDLRTPITVIGGFSATLRAHGENLDDRQRQWLERITGAARRLDALVEQLVLVSAWEAGEARPEPADVDLVGLLARVRAGAREPERVALECPPALTLRSDARFLGQAVGLLADHLLKESDGVRITATAGGGSVRVEVSAGGAEPAGAPAGAGVVRRAGPAGLDLGLGPYLAGVLAGALGADLEHCSGGGEGERFTIGLPAPSGTGTGGA